MISSDLAVKWSAFSERFVIPWQSRGLCSEMIFRSNFYILKMNPRPTAIFALNDLMALGALLAAAEAGYSVPRDLAVVRYDNLEIAHYTNPPLTTIAQSKKETGVQALNLLVDRIFRNSRTPSRLVLSPELIVRRSAPAVM